MGLQAQLEEQSERREETSASCRSATLGAGGEEMRLQAAADGKRKPEADLQQLTQDHGRAVREVDRLAGELRHEQEHVLHLEKVRKGPETQVKDMSARAEEVEQLALKGGKRMIHKLEGKRHVEEAVRQAQNPGEMLTVSAGQDVLLTCSSVAWYEEKEEQQANVNLAKYRKTVCELDDAEERADITKSALTKISSKRRGSFSKGFSSGLNTPYRGLFRSPGSARPEVHGEKTNSDDTVGSLIPAYLDSPKKLTIED
ncbi:myosin-16-like [Arapaima gigas]